MPLKLTKKQVIDIAFSLRTQAIIHDGVNPHCWITALMMQLPSLSTPRGRASKFTSMAKPFKDGVDQGRSSQFRVEK